MVRVVTALAVIGGVVATLSGCGSGSGQPPSTGVPSTAGLINNTHRTAQAAVCATTAAIRSIHCGTQVPRVLHRGQSTTFSYGPSADGGAPSVTLVVKEIGGMLRCARVPGTPSALASTTKILGGTSAEECA